MFVLYTQFRNVAAGRIIQTGGPQVGDIWYGAQWLLDPISLLSFIR